MFKLVLEKAEEPNIIANICWMTAKAREFQKNICFCFIVYAKAFDCVDHNKLENSERDENIRPPDLPLRNLYEDPKATVRTGHGTMNWFQIGKELCQDCILSPCFFKLYAEYIMRNARLDEAQAGIKMSERGEELKSFLMKVKEESEKLA